MYMEFTTSRCTIKNFISEYISIMYEGWGTDRDVGMYLLDFKEDMTLDEFKSYILETYKSDYNDISVIQEKSSNNIIYQFI